MKQPSAPTLDIQPLTPEQFPDSATLFEELGDPRWCWSQWQAGRHHSNEFVQHRTRPMTIRL